MLSRLHIQNFALISEATVNFPGGLTVITGETGAGKSIMLGALALVLGERADGGSIPDKSKKCIIEANFSVGTYQLRGFFDEHELDYADETVMRREISADGKTRSFINDTPVTLQVMRQLGSRLVDVHSQHETLLLSEAGFRFQVIDAYAGILNEVSSYRKLFNQLKKKEAELIALERDAAQARRDFDYLSFQLKELSEANIRAGELEDLEKEAVTLENAESIRETLNSSADALSNSEQNVLSMLASLKNSLAAIAKYGSAYEEISKRVSAAYIELKDLSEEMESLASAVASNPERLQQVNEKLDALNRLLKKHGVGSEEALIQLKDEIETKLNKAESDDTQLLQLKKEVEQLKAKLNTEAHKISSARKKCVAKLEGEVQKHLEKLHLPNARFKVEIQNAKAPGINGIDELEFLFSANKGGTFRELHKVASGGELSRLMLCIKAIVSNLLALPAIIFDEIDTGVSGEAGAAIGNMLQQMSQGMQVITITHLPQIASRGTHHLFVYKKDIGETTQSFIRTLAAEDRVTEIAKMLSTGVATDAAINNARELLGVKK